MSATQLDRAALVWGAVFTVIGGSFLAQEWGLWSVRAQIVVPLLLIVAGAVLLLSAASRRQAP